MKKIPDMKPYVGEFMHYLYDGSSNEQLRAGSVYALHLFLDGPGEMEIDGERHPIERHTLIFLRPGQPHAFHISPDHPLPSFNIYFDLWDDESPASLHRSFIYAPEAFVFEHMAAMPACPELDELPSVINLRDHPQLIDTFTMITRAYKDLEYYRSETTNSFLYAWMLSWYNALHVKKPQDYRIVRLIEYMQHHPEQGQSVDEWSSYCGLKRTYIHELFLQETGQTPRSYHHELVMKRSAHMMLESDLTITEIAEKLRYSSIHPFSRHFREYFGISPSQYRANHRQS
ncbi:AraC family transcriptional regulator [Paenibacillus chibensis]|uniref:AraC family transcriptional regulator n=1 Tax=Paenibacillus chibensis TaxID=59846 RepID=UPI000FDBA0FF|nr:AraC family transcriptional regulator [Paenibacillus chibensis]MEC0371310.1 AraC family transcriptional regulator [Paenibacillus chibensis]